MSDTLNIIPHEPEEIETDDYLDSRDIQERIDWLESDAASKERYQDKEIEEFKEELKALADLKEQYINDYGESSWGYGAQFHRVDDFANYAEEFCADVGYIKDDLPFFIASHIDWQGVADEMAMDYTSVTFKGVEYYTQEA